MTFKIFKRRVKISIQTTTSFRMTSIIMFIVSLLFFILEIFTGIIFFEYTDRVAGFTKNDYLNLIITGNIIVNIYSTIFLEGYYKLIEDVLYGGMDYIFVRPVNSFLFYIFHGINLQNLLTSILYIILQIILFSKQNIEIFNIFLYIIFILIGIWYQFLFNFFIAIVSFYTDKATALFGINEILEDLGKKPSKIYPKIIRFFLLYIISYVFVFNAPINILQNKISYLNVIIYILSCIILTGILYRLWFKSIKKYQSAN